MSRNGQAHSTSPGAVLVGTFPMPPGTGFDRHVHRSHQLAWAPTGVLNVSTAERTWVLPPTRALWIPAQVPHEVISSGLTTMKSLYLKPDRCAISWPDPRPVAVSALLCELIQHLDSTTLGQDRRARAEALLVDLLEPVPVTPIDLPMPNDERARAVAQALLEHPADNRSLSAWGHTVGASGRTLARTFVGDTGITFGRWRTLLRLRAALPTLASGSPVSRVARAVGYETASAFVAAFRRETGVTPATYFRDSCD